MAETLYDTGHLHPVLSLGVQEMDGEPPKDAETARIARDNADLLVSQLMLSETSQHRAKRGNTLNTVQVPDPALGDIIPTAPIVQSRRKEAPFTPRSDQRFQPLIEDSTPAVHPARCAVKPSEKTDEDRLRAALTEDSLAADLPSDDRRQLRPILLLTVGIGGLAFLTFAAPLVVLGFGLGVVVGFLSLPILMRHTVSGHLLARLWVRFANDKPRKAERVRKGADKLAMAMDRLLDHLPAPWADRLAMPDFSQPIEGESRKI